MIAGKRLKTMRKLVTLVSLINAQVGFADYHQPLRRTLVKVVNLPKQDFQLFWREFNANGELLARLTVLQAALQRDNLELLLRENADLANEVNKTIQALLAAMTDGLKGIEVTQRQAAEHSCQQQSKQLLNDFKAVTESRK